MSERTVNERLAVLMGWRRVEKPRDSWWYHAVLGETRLLPPYDSSLEAMAEVERRIGEMGGTAKTDYSYLVVAERLRAPGATVSILDFHLITAPASVRAVAALAVLEAAK